MFTNNTMKRKWFGIILAALDTATFIIFFNHFYFSSWIKGSISMLEFQFPKSSSYFPLFLLLSPLYIQIYCCMYASLVIMHSLHHYMLKIKQNINRGKILTAHHMTLVTLQKWYDILGIWYLDNCIKNFSITWEDEIWSRFEIFKNFTCWRQVNCDWDTLYNLCAFEA